VHKKETLTVQFTPFVVFLRNDKFS